METLWMDLNFIELLAISQLITSETALVVAVSNHKQ